jgi:protoheme IX farnesyltransferase
MLPVTAGNKITKYNIFGYSLVLAACTLAPYFIGFSGLIYLVFAVVYNIVFIYLATRLMLEKEITFAGKTFGFSIMYLFVLFLALVVDKLVS